MPFFTLHSATLCHVPFVLPEGRRQIPHPSQPPILLSLPQTLCSLPAETMAILGALEASYNKHPRPRAQVMGPNSVFLSFIHLSISLILGDRTVAGLWRRRTPSVLPGRSLRSIFARCWLAEFLPHVQGGLCVLVCLSLPHAHGSPGSPLSAQLTTCHMGRLGSPTLLYS